MFSQKLTTLFAILAGIIVSTQAGAAPAASLVLLGDFTNPTYVGVAPGETRLLFIVERAGKIQVMQDEERLPQPFLDISDLVKARPGEGAGVEQGLLSVAFPADYVSTRRFYVAFTNNDGDVEIDEFHRAQANRFKANVATRRIVLVIPHRDGQNHNGGQLNFFRDGLLYISTGDGGGSANPRGENARDLESLLGKILRIDPLPSGGLPYTIPKTNPFVGKPGRNEIFAYGLRNPWRFSFDGEMMAIADVGQHTQEEVNLLPVRDVRGSNFGWPQYEGDLVFDDTRPGQDPPKFPIHTYDHGTDRCAIVGGHVVRDTTLIALKGRYLYGDYCSGELRSFIAHVTSQEAVNDRPANIVVPGLTSFGQGFNGKTYVVQFNGNVSRLAPP